MKLVIVESPGKIKTLQKILGKNYIIAASVGHIIDLPAKTLGIYKSNNKFYPTYTILPGKQKIVSSLKKLVKIVDSVILATDNDREGEFIAYSLYKYLNLKSYERIIFNSITKDAILNAINNPIKINLKLVQSQQKRRMIDRLIGYKITPILYKSREISQDVKKDRLSVGRVQTVMVRFIYDRTNERDTIINNLKSGQLKYNHEIIGDFFVKDIPLKFKLYNKDKLYLISIDDLNFESTIKPLLTELYNSKWYINAVNEKFINENPPEPFKTTTLQQEANNKFKFTPKYTMNIAQKLYEKGYITYMRTESCFLANETIVPIKDYIINKYSDKLYFFRSFDRSKSIKSKTNITEAHEAIRPINFNKFDDIKNLTIDEIKLYKCIFNRTIASQMIPCRKRNLDIELEILENSKEYYFRGNFIETVELGFKIVYDENIDYISTEIKNTDINSNSSIIIKQIFTSPKFDITIPKMYNSIGLIKALEKKEIGRPSTYASLLDKIFISYVKIGKVDGIQITIPTANVINNIFKIKKNIIKLGYENNILIVTNTGKVIVKFLLSNKLYAKYFDYDYTKYLEKLI